MSVRAATSGSGILRSPQSVSRVWRTLDGKLEGVLPKSWRASGPRAAPSEPRKAETHTTAEDTQDAEKDGVKTRARSPAELDHSRRKGRQKAERELLMDTDKDPKTIGSQFFLAHKVKLEDLYLNYQHTHTHTFPILGDEKLFRGILRKLPFRSAPLQVGRLVVLGSRSSTLSSSSPKSRSTFPIPAGR